MRLHHGRRGRRGNYSETELDEWARRIAQWRRRAEVFVYFNNDWEGFAVKNALLAQAAAAAVSRRVSARLKSRDTCICE